MKVDIKYAGKKHLIKMIKELNKKLEMQNMEIGNLNYTIQSLEGRIEGLDIINTEYAKTISEMK